MPGATLAQIEAAAGRERLFVSGIVPVLPEDDLGAARTVLLLSPDEPGFWQHVTAAPEFADGARDPLDRWSLRIIGALANEACGTALFPFTGPPWQPFTRWALRSGRSHPSPVTLTVHDRMGLWASFRGAIAVTQAITPAPAPSPCASCSGRPCLDACPPRALTAHGYDLAACHGFLDREEGSACLSGCAVRRACPISQHYGRLSEQSAHHMRYFHK
jgi:epoxyqueuosine reductase